MNQDEFDESCEDEPHRTTNIEMLEQIMTFSRYGALVQIFVMFAVEIYCDDVLSQTPEEINEKLKGAVPVDRWKGVAAEIKQKLDGYRNRE